MPKLKGIQNCFTPDSLEDAAAILEKAHGKAVIVGGGLDITVFAYPNIEQFIFLDKLNLNYIKDEGEKIKIGAGTSISEIERSDIMESYLKGKVKEVLGEIATQLLRNQITIGGSVARRQPYSDIVSMLYSLKGRVIISDGKWDEELFIDDFYRGNFQKLIKSRIITEIVLDKRDDSYKFGMRRFVRNATDIPLFNIAILAKIEQDIIRDVSISVGSRPKPAYRFAKGEEFLKDKKLSSTLANDFGVFTKSNIDVGKDMRLSEEYRRHIAGVYAKKILLDFLEV